MQIFLLDVKEQDRSRADGLLWKQDTQWARILDEGWDLGRVKEATPPHPCTLLFLDIAVGCSVLWSCRELDALGWPS